MKSNYHFLPVTGQWFASFLSMLSSRTAFASYRLYTFQRQRRLIQHKFFSQNNPAKQMQKNNSLPRFFWSVLLSSAFAEGKWSWAADRLPLFRSALNSQKKVINLSLKAVGTEKEFLQEDGCSVSQQLLFPSSCFLSADWVFAPSLRERMLSFSDWTQLWQSCRVSE